MSVKKIGLCSALVTFVALTGCETGTHVEVDEHPQDNGLVFHSMNVTAHAKGGTGYIQGTDVRGPDGTTIMSLRGAGLKNSAFAGQLAMSPLTAVVNGQYQKDIAGMSDCGDNPCEVTILNNGASASAVSDSNSKSTVWDGPSRNLTDLNRSIAEATGIGRQRVEWGEYTDPKDGATKIYLILL